VTSRFHFSNCSCKWRLWVDD